MKLIADAYGSLISPLIPVPRIPSIIISGLKSKSVELPVTNLTEGIFSSNDQFQLLSSVLILSGVPSKTTITFAL